MTRQVEDITRTASMGPRDCSRGNTTSQTSPSMPLALQWGRAIARAEIGRGAEGVGQVHPASMGPRDCSRGNVRTHGASRSLWPSFNGAARLLARKSTKVVGCGVFMGCFNGAARLLARKSPPGCSLATPPPHCFNGAARLLARKLPKNKNYSPLTVASMGPRDCSRGNLDNW